MFGQPPKTPGSVAILDVDRLVRWFLLEGHLDHLVEIGRHLDWDEIERLKEVVASMADADVCAWVAWLLQLGPQAAAVEITRKLL